MRRGDRNKVKGCTDQGKPKENNDHRNEETIDQNVYVKVVPRIDSIENFREDYKTCQRENGTPKWQDTLLV